VLVIERLDAHGIAGEDETFSRGVPKREGKHSNEASEAVFSPRAIRGENYFSVGMAFEFDARRLEFITKSAKVIYLTVEDNPIAGGGIVHRLMT
jgi:hypothetical protein